MKYTDVQIQKLRSYSRWSIVGTSGAGKTTFGRRLSDLLGIPHFQMDALFWKENWQASTVQELTEKVEDVLSRPAWILDGNYSSVKELRWRDAQVVVWIDPPFWVTTWRIIRRSAVRVWKREEIWPGTGNRETFVKSFLKPNSIIIWSVTTFHRNRRRYSRLMKDPRYAHLEFVQLRSAKDMDQFLELLAQP